jgi:NAD(P)-dependent dehydrogenase (short-subunit alcohol dehydrogenase family)
MWHDIQWTMDFTNRTVLITGGGSGIGAATAKKFAEYGANVVVTDINQESAELVAASIKQSGGKAMALKLDITDLANWENVRTRVHEVYGKMNVIFNNAYIKIEKPAHLTTVEEWDRQINVNFGGIHKSVIVFTQDLEESQGCIVNTASVHALFGFLGHGAYAATKGGIVSLSNQLAIEYGPKIRVNSVLPGPILTPVWDTETEAGIDEAIRGTALNRMGMPAEVAEAVCFLSSAAASYITGASLLVDGGFSARKTLQAG